MITAMPRIAIAVRDFAMAVSTFREVFGMPVVDFSSRTVPDLGAHVGMCVPEGGSNIELMSPASPDAPLSQSLSKFLDRRGEGLYALMLEAPDPDAEAGLLSARGVSVLPLMKGAGGRDVHPRSTHGVLIRIYPDNSVREQAGQVSASPGFSGITKVVVATADASRAAAAYGRRLGLEVGPATRDDERGVLQVLCRPPKGGVIELVSAVDIGRPFAREIDRFVTEGNEGLYALVLEADHPEAAASVLRSRGGIGDDSAGAEISIFGTRFLIEQEGSDHEGARDAA